MDLLQLLALLIAKKYLIGVQDLILFQENHLSLNHQKRFQLIKLDISYGDILMEMDQLYWEMAQETST